MITKEKETIIEQLKSIRNEENCEIIDSAIHCIKTLSDECKSMTTSYVECGNRLREVALEIESLKDQLTVMH